MSQVLFRAGGQRASASTSSYVNQSIGNRQRLWSELRDFYIFRKNPQNMRGASSQGLLRFEDLSDLGFRGRHSVHVRRGRRYPRGLASLCELSLFTGCTAVALSAPSSRTLFGPGLATRSERTCDNPVLSCVGVSSLWTLSWKQNRTRPRGLRLLHKHPLNSWRSEVLGF